MTMRKTTPSEAEQYCHADTAKTKTYNFERDGRTFHGTLIRTVCRHWFSACEDDPERYRPERWAFNRADGWPNCPRCVEISPTEYPGMLLVVRGALGIPQIVRVTDEATWEGMFGFTRGRDVNPSGKQVLHVCSEGDVFEDIGLVVKDGGLAPVVEDKLIDAGGEDNAASI